MYFNPYTGPTHIELCESPIDEQQTLLSIGVHHTDRAVRKFFRML
jgi:hypothetical protein